MLKKTLIKLRGNKCEICEITEWMQQPITMMEHHIDLNRNNNVQENKLLLCPNCHSQKHATRTEEFKRKVSLAKKGVKRTTPVSVETRLKMSLNNRGDKNPNYGKRTIHSEETKRKISNTLKGRRFSEEHLRNLKIAKRHVDSTT